MQCGPEGKLEGDTSLGTRALESCAFLAQSMLAHNFRDGPPISANEMEMFQVQTIVRFSNSKHLTYSNKTEHLQQGFTVFYLFHFNQAYQLQNASLTGIPHGYNEIQEHSTGKGCMPMEPDSTVNFFQNHQARMYCSGQNSAMHYMCNYPERHIEEGMKKMLHSKTEIPHPATPEKFHPPESPSKPQHHMHHCQDIHSLPPSPQCHPYNDANSKLQEVASTFNATHHHPTYHNNNQAWPQSVCHSDHQHNHPSPSHANLSQQQTYPHLGSYGYHNGQTSAYHETHFGQHMQQINPEGYNEIYNQHN